jgi:hypothetical protein
MDMERLDDRMVTQKRSPPDDPTRAGNDEKRRSAFGSGGRQGEVLYLDDTAGQPHLKIPGREAYAGAALHGARHACDDRLPDGVASEPEENGRGEDEDDDGSNGQDPDADAPPPTTTGPSTEGQRGVSG